MYFKSTSISIYFFKHPQTDILKTVTNVVAFKLTIYSLEVKTKYRYM